MNLPAILALAIVFLPVPVLTEPSDEKVAIFVGPQTREGFIDVDQGVLDSIKDLRDEFRRTAQFRLVEKRDDAKILLLVTGRRVAGQSGAVAAPVGTMAVLVPIKRLAIDAILRVGDYEKAIIGIAENHDTWRASARQVVKDVAAWAAVNRERLLERPQN